MENIIEVKDLNKVYKLYNKTGDRIKESLFPKLCKGKTKDFYALQGVNFSIKSGETVGIIGKNGSGKSTLLKILTGVISQTSGEKNIKGKISALLELGAGFNPEYTGIENIYLNGTIMGFTKEQMKEKIDDIISFAEIGEFINHPVKSYSSGMFVRLAFAVAINVNPEILIVDEALAVGDYRFQAKCYNKFEELKAMGKTILFVTHDVDAVRRFCTRALWIDSGKLIMDGNVNEVTSKYMEFIVGSEKNVSVEVKDEKKEETEAVSIREMNPINRFGSDVGVIKSVRIFNGDKETDVFSLYDDIKVVIEVDIPENANLETVGFAVSIKNKNGTDLFVTALHDEGLRFERCGKNILSFKFKNYLNIGEYTMTAALEKRDTIPIAYYDYIEGAAYIRSLSDKEYFGLMKFPSEIVLGENK